MARYCFYCGRALSPGEKCTCREDSRKKTDSADGSDQQASHAKTTESFSKKDPATGSQANKRASSSWAEKLNQQREKNRTARAKAAAGVKPRSKPIFRKPDKMAVFASLQQFIRFFTKPADTVRQAVQFADRRKAVILLTVEGLTGGILMAALAAKDEISGLFQLTIIQTGSRSAILNGLFLFMQGVSLVLSLHLILAALLYFLLKIFVRQPVDFTRLISSISPISFYSAMFLLMSSMAMRGSMFYAVMLLVACFGMTMMMMFITLRQLCQIEENRAAGLTALLMTAYAAVISLMISQIAPVLKTLFDMQLAL